MIDWSFVWSWVTARLMENVVDLVIGAVIILLIFLLIAFRLLWDNHIRYWWLWVPRPSGRVGKQPPLRA